MGVDHYSADEEIKAPRFDSAPDTYKHKNRVLHLMTRLAHELIERACDHDASKLVPPEKEYFDEFTPKLAGSTFGSEEYKGFLRAMQPVLSHHYMLNRHHPEFHADGVAGMNLVDLIEMICDWKAASERHANGNIFDSIEKNSTRFNIYGDLKQILVNTAQLME